MIMPKAKAPSRLSPRRGFTLMEMMLSVTIMLLVFAITFPSFRAQLRAMGSHAGRFDAQQNVRFAMSALEREVRVAGAGVTDKQPLIVQASPFALTFTADLATRDTATEGGAYHAVYFDADLPAGSTMGMTVAQATALPLSSVVWPTTEYYRSAGIPSSAETISFWVDVDGSPGSNGRYALFRRVNGGVIDTLARGLIMDPLVPPFTYQVLNATGQLADIPASSLPAYHIQDHGSPADTGSSGLTDQIRYVKVHLTGSFVERDGTTTTRTADAGIRLLNAGLLNHATCGDPPVFNQAVGRVYQAAPNKQVILSWSAALDEAGGEKDVEKYVIYRRAPAASYGEPLASVPAGHSTYQFSDTQIASNDHWIYAVAAVDCGGQASPESESAQIDIP